ncbi:unnamed protein product [Blepharisma stoltei]|uniref:Uncharacterized protein n=1 Tax=Blepharisma stoltei TaxID=1481888 RepID=A0AAU9JAY6_9CILI|nr:unnamed protein product [Blepharisma stoltei]
MVKKKNICSIKVFKKLHIKCFIIMEEIPEEFFLCEEYTLFNESLGEYTQEFYALKSACTDYDLTGQVIWPGAKILSQYLLENQHKLQDKDLLEVGSGSGFTGLFCSHFARKVVLSDGNDIVLRLLEKNKVFGHCPIFVCKIEWNEDNSAAELESKELPIKYPVIIGSDVIYSIDAVIPLFNTINKHLENDGEFIMCYTNRAMNNYRVLLEESEKLGFSHEVLWNELNVYLYSFKKINN